jgi:hypothetical protein
LISSAASRELDLDLLEVALALELGMAPDVVDA